MPGMPVGYQPAPYVRDNSLGQLLRMQGQNRANAELQRGSIAAQLWANLGNQLSQSIQGYAQEKQQAPIRAQEAEARALQIANAKAEQAARQQQTQSAEALRTAQNSSRDPEQVKARLMEAGRADLIPTFEKTWSELESSRLGLQKAKTEVAALESDYFGAMAAGIKKAKYDPMAIEWALTEAAEDGHDVTQIRQLLQQQPDKLPSLVDSLIEKSPTQRKLSGEEADRALKTKQEERALADVTADNARQAEAAAETARHNKEQERIASLTAGRAAASEAETARHNRAMEENARNAKIGRPVIAGDAEDIAAMDEAIALSEGLNFKPGDTGIMPSIGGAMPDAVTNLTGFGVDAKQRQGIINLSKQIIGKGLEGGVLRKEDEDKYKKILVTLSDHPDVVVSKVKNMIKTIEQKREMRLNAMEDAGYNVSKFRQRQQEAADGGGDDAYAAYLKRQEAAGAR